MSVSFFVHEISNPIMYVLSLLFGMFICLFVIVHFVWYSFGLEKLIISHGNLTIVRSCRIFSIKRTIPIKDVIDIKVFKSSIEPLSELNRPHTIADEIEDLKLSLQETKRSSFVWNRTGKLLIQTNAGNHHVLNGLKEDKFFIVQNVLMEKLGMK